MGYFTAGFALHQEPDWKSLPPCLGYAHKTEKLYLLAFQETRRRNEEYPFTEFMVDERYETGRPDTPLMQTLARASHAVAGGYYDTLVRNALQIAQDLKGPLLFFAVNDDMLNLGFTQDAQGNLTGFLFQSEGQVELHEGKVRVCPIWSEEDEEEFGPDPSQLDGVEWGPAQNADIRFCSAPLTLWPAGWPDPTKAFGLGSWDIFENFNEDFVRKL